MADTAISGSPAAKREVLRVEGLSNQEFLERYAGPGRIGLAGGLTLIDRIICRAERHVDENDRWSTWSHAFIFQGRRIDGHDWVLESDLQIEHKHIHLGVQENRVSKYHDEKLYTNLAIIDLGLPEEKNHHIVREGLELVASRTRYSMRELIGTLIALRKPDARTKDNPMEQESSFYCSAFVRHVFQKAEIDLTPGLAQKHTTPEDLVRTEIPHKIYILERHTLESRVKKLAGQIRQRVKTRIETIRKKKP